MTNAPIEWSEAEEDLAVQYLRALRTHQAAHDALTAALANIQQCERQIAALGMDRSGRGRRLRKEVQRRIELGAAYLHHLEVFRWDKGGPFDLDDYLAQQRPEN